MAARAPLPHGQRHAVWVTGASRSSRQRRGKIPSSQMDSIDDDFVRAQLAQHAMTCMEHSGSERCFSQFECHMKLMSLLLIEYAGPWSD